MRLCSITLLLCETECGRLANEVPVVGQLHEMKVKTNMSQPLFMKILRLTASVCAVEVIRSYLLRPFFPFVVPWCHFCAAASA